MTVETPALPNYCWPVDWACNQEMYDDLATMPDPDNPDGPRIPNPQGLEVIARAEALSTQTLRMLTGYRVGGCPVVVRPCKRSCVPSSWLTAPAGIGSFAGYAGWTFQPYVQDGKWLNACGCWKDDCSCTALQQVPLPAPVGSIDSVWLDGELVPAMAYRVDNGNMLVRTDGGEWPVCQDMNIDDPSEGGFFVSYTNAIPADGVASYAAGLLAVEYAKACTGGKCRLPAGVSEITRAGITMTITTGAFPGGMTGIREIDSFIQFWNPYAVKSEAQVFSPDVPSPRRTTWRAF